MSYLSEEADIEKHTSDIPVDTEKAVLLHR